MIRDAFVPKTLTGYEQTSTKTFQEDHVDFGVATLNMGITLMRFPNSDWVDFFRTYAGIQLAFGLQF